MLQISLQCLGTLVTAATIFLHRSADDAFQLHGKCRVERARCRWLLVQDGIQSGHDVAALKWLFPGRHFVKHYTERKEVAARIKFLASGLFRRHVDRGPGNYTDSRKRVLDGSLLAGCQLLIAQQFSQTKIEHLSLPALSDEDIGGLYIAVQDS